MPAIVPNNTSDRIQPHLQGPRWLDAASGVAMAFCWGLAEGTLFFVVPDVLISLAAMTRPTRVWRHVLAATAGALVAGTLLYSWAARDPKQAEASVAQVPFVRMKMLENVHRSYAQRGTGAIFLGPLTGTPYKIYAVEAPEFIGRNAFLCASIPARAERFLLVWAVFAFAGSQLRRRFRPSDRQLIIGHACFWVVFYAFYWGRIVLR